MAPTMPSNDRFNSLLTLALFVFAFGVVIAWRRTHDPLRAWARHAETLHTEKINRPLRRCFGPLDAVSLRALSVAVRRGPTPMPFAACRGSVLSEATVAPATFVEALRDAPTAVFPLRDRERGEISRMEPTLRRLGSEVVKVPGTPTDAQRSAIADRLDDAIAEINQEQQAFADLLRTAHDAAPMF